VCAAITGFDSISSVRKDAPLGGLAQEYLQALLRGDRRLAGRLIFDAVDAGAAIKDLYLDVFEAAQREVGRLWQINRISVAQEHYCTAAAQLIMSQLYPRIFRTPRKGRRMVAACVSGELHEIGVRMVSDILETEGWDTFYLGASTPASSLPDMLREHKAGVLAISVTMTAHLPEAERLVGCIRQSDGCKGVKILVGGYPFNAAEGLWSRIGADGYARNCGEAAAAANRLLA
jgi:methanogenic corrinoid protein MtbC1